MLILSRIQRVRWTLSASVGSSDRPGIPSDAFIDQSPDSAVRKVSTEVDQKAITPRHQGGEGIGRRGGSVCCSGRTEWRTACQ